jgi:hypothetical protein
MGLYNHMHLQFKPLLRTQNAIPKCIIDKYLGGYLHTLCRYQKYIHAYLIIQSQIVWHFSHRQDFWCRKKKKAMSHFWLAKSSCSSSLFCFKISNMSANNITFCKWSSCLASFQTLDELTPHLFKTHGLDSSAHCYWGSCSESLQGGALLDHLTRQHLKQYCRWSGCAEQYETIERLDLHLSNKHIGTGQSEYTCQWESCTRAGKPFSQRQKIIRHLHTHTGNKVVVF